MEKNVDVSRDLARARLKKEALSRTCELAHAQASSVFSFTIQWKDVEEHLEKTMRYVEERNVELDKKTKMLDEREWVVDLREREFNLVCNRIEECNMKLEAKVRELRSVEKSIELCGLELKAKQEELVAVRVKIGECGSEVEKRRDELDVLQRTLLSLSRELDGKKDELSLVEDSVEKLMWEKETLQNEISKCDEQVDAKQKELVRVRMKIDECGSDFEKRRNELDELESSVLSCTRELNSKKDELRLVEDSVEKIMSEKETLHNVIRECNEELELKMIQLSETERLTEVRKKEFALKADSYKRLVRQLKEKVGAKDYVVGKTDESIEVCKRKLEAKRKKLKLTGINALSEDTNEQGQELSTQTTQQNSVQEIQEQSTDGPEVTEELTASLAKCFERIGSEKGHLEELPDQDLSKELELVFIKTVTDQYLKELREKEEHFDSIKKSLTEHMQDLEVFEERVKELETKERESQKTIEEQHQKLQMQETQLFSIHHSQIRNEQAASSEANECVNLLHSLLETCIVDGEKMLWLLMNENLKRNGSSSLEIFNAIKKAPDPAKLVLDTLHGFFPAYLQHKDNEIDVIKRNCIQLLEHLWSFSPQITPQVQYDALKLAGEWKMNMIVAENHSLEVLGFLLLVAAFGLATELDRNELPKLLAIADPHKQMPELICALGIETESPDINILPSGLETEQVEHALDMEVEIIDLLSEDEENNNEHVPTAFANEDSDNDVYAALSVSLDPPKFALDFIQNTYSENLKKGGNMEEGDISFLILILDQLKNFQLKINPQIKVQATKVAIEWKSKMEVVAENLSAVLFFLLFLATFEVATYFDREENLYLLSAVIQDRRAPELCRSLDAAALVPGFIHDLIGRKQHLQAVRFICTFNLIDSISPETVLQQYLAHVGRTSCYLYSQGTNYIQTKNKAIDFEIASLRALNECIQECKLEYLIRSNDIHYWIVWVEQRKLTPSITLDSSIAKILELLQSKLVSSSTSNQLSSPCITQPQQRTINNTIADSPAAVPAPPRLQFEAVTLKRARTDSSSHTLQIPSPVTPSATLLGNCRWHGPAVPRRARSSRGKYRTIRLLNTINQ